MSVIAVVVPSNREEALAKMLDAWHYFPGCELIIAEDNDERTFKLDEADGLHTLHFSHAEIKDHLGDHAWIIPKGSAAIRSYGFLMAAEAPIETGSVDYIITLDDDCFPEEEDSDYLVDLHVEMLERPATLDWYEAYPKVFTRGFPYAIRHASETWINHGLWSGVLDLDAKTQLGLEHLSNQWDRTRNPSTVIPRYSFAPMCGMNLAFKKEAAPLMYFTLQGRDWKYNRFDDIWCGLFAKKILDTLGKAMRSGLPAVHHTRLSDPKKNLELEAPGMEANEWLWELVRRAEITPGTVPNMYSQLGLVIRRHGNIMNDEYFSKLGEAMQLWATLW